MATNRYCSYANRSQMLRKCVRKVCRLCSPRDFANVACKNSLVLEIRRGLRRPRVQFSRAPHSVDVSNLNFENILYCVLDLVHYVIFSIGVNKDGLGVGSLLVLFLLQSLRIVN